MNAIYEYKVIQITTGENKDKLEGFLDSWGAIGWELCHWERYIDASVYVFKRLKDKEY